MATAAQIEANRSNAQHSTGPVTQDGRLSSARNNLRHGLACKQILIQGEDRLEFEALVKNYADEHQPSTPTEAALVDGLAKHEWLANRALYLQSQCFNGDEVDEKKLALYLRYESTHRRQYSKCLNDLLKLRKEKRQAEIGFESQKRTEAESARRQELHEAKVRLTNARAQETEIGSEIRQTMEAPLPGNLRIPFDTLKSLFEAAVREVGKVQGAA
jgi:hypothetical protein